MEIEAISTVDPAAITINQEKPSEDDKDAGKRTVLSNMEKENYYKYLVSRKKAWYQEYLDVFTKIKDNVPVAFYAGQRNELMDSINGVVTKPSTGVFDAVRDFFLRK